MTWLLQVANMIPQILLPGKKAGIRNMSKSITMCNMVGFDDIYSAHANQKYISSQVV